MRTIVTPKECEDSTRGKEFPITSWRNDSKFGSCQGDRKSDKNERLGITAQVAEAPDKNGGVTKNLTDDKCKDLRTGWTNGREA